MDQHANFGYSTVLFAPSPATSGVNITLASGGGALMPAVPFNATVWPAGVAPIASNAEIVRVTGKSGDLLGVARAQEGTSARVIVVGDQLAATITKKTLNDVEAIPVSWTVRDLSGAGLTFTESFPATYALIGRLVLASFAIVYPSTASGLQSVIELPFSAEAAMQYPLLVTFTTLGSGITGACVGNAVYLYTLGGASITNANMSGKALRAIAIFIAA